MEGAKELGGARILQKRALIIFLLALALIIFFLRIVGLITDWYWFEEVGYVNVFTVALWTQLKMTLFFGVAVFVIFYGNLFAAVRLSSDIHIVD